MIPQHQPPRQQHIQPFWQSQPRQSSSHLPAFPSTLSDRLHWPRANLFRSWGGASVQILPYSSMALRGLILSLFPSRVPNGKCPSRGPREPHQCLATVRPTMSPRPANSRSRRTIPQSQPPKPEPHLQARRDAPGPPGHGHQNPQFLVPTSFAIYRAYF